MHNYYLGTSVFSGSSEISKYLYYSTENYVNMGSDRGGLLLLDGTVNILFMLTFLVVIVISVSCTSNPQDLEG